MEQVINQYGSTILKILVFVALAGILITALTSDGYVAVAFREAVISFLEKMNAVAPSTPPS